MENELNLVADLALILIAAGVFTIISRALKQPLILGYIIAGFVVGPHLGLFPKMTSLESVNQWSEIGIIFLLFALGLEFSFKKLLKVGNSAFITAGTTCVGMFAVGLLVGRSFEWTMMESIFLGGLLAMSSTTIIIKTFGDLGLKKKPYAELIFGALVIEDLIAVLLMVLLSTLAVSNKFDGGEMIWSFAKLVFFLVLWFIVGIFAIPSILKRAHKYLNDEILLIVAIGLCFGMVILASAVGFSSALGAFVMGSILAETIEAERIHHLVSSIKDLFGAIFFVSVGMMVDPAIIGTYWGTILILVVVNVLGILTFSTTGALLAGKTLNTAIHTGFSLAQLGEFAFILAQLGCNLGVVRSEIYPIIITVSVITAFTTPYMIKAATPASKWLHKNLPERMLSRIKTVETAKPSYSQAAQSEWKKLIRSYLIRVVLYSVILIAIYLGSVLFLDGFVHRLLSNTSEWIIKLIIVATTIVIMAPFVFGLSVSNGSIAVHAKRLIKEREENRWPVMALMLIRSIIGIGFVQSVITTYFKLSWWALLLLFISALAIIVILRSSVHNISEVEKRFINNYKEKELEEKRKTPVKTSLKETLSGYDVHLESIILSPDSGYSGKTLREMPFRHESGVNIINVTRGTQAFLIPAGDFRLYPYDNILAVGSSTQINSFKEIMKNDILEEGAFSTSMKPQYDRSFSVEKCTLQEDSYLSGKTLRELSMRGKGCMIVGILHDDKLMVNPKPETMLKPDDTVWIAGEKDSCRFFMK